MEEKSLEMLTLHALYYLAEAGGWRSGLRWRLTSRGVFSPDLQRALALGRPPVPDREALERVKRLIALLCGGNGEPCGLLVVAAAKYAALRRLGIGYEEAHVAPPRLAGRLEAALLAAGLLPRKETIITPKLVAH